jgi:hypothetical protein
MKLRQLALEAFGAQRQLQASFGEHVFIFHFFVRGGFTV